jgi:glycerate 2-kinase
MVPPVAHPDRQLLLNLYRDACAQLDAGRLAVAALTQVPAGAGLLALGKVAHRQMRAVLAARPDLRPLLSISTDAGPEPWAIAGEHPVPDICSFQAGEALLGLVRANDGLPLVLLLSGGGSALAAVPREGIEDFDKADVTALLLRSGLDIGQMNTVRKRLSAIKGGRLAAAAPRSAWTVLAMSDVVGDDLGTIASGPCTPDHARPSEARQICRRAGLWDRLPQRVRELFLRDDPAPSLEGVAVESRVLAGARTLAITAEALAPWPATTLAPVQEPVEVLAKRYASWVADRSESGPALLIATGEPTLRVTGPGRGGRAQHLALLMAAELRGLNACFLAAGTDGRDGPTEHAGAIVDGATAADAGARLGAAISGFDSAPLHAELGTAIPRWTPCTHLGELYLLLVY